MMFEDFNIAKRDKYYLAFITIFSTILVAYYISFNMKIGISCSDVYLYLLNALYFTGTNIHSTDTIYLSPIICFLTSILFRLGITSQLAIYIVTGAFAVLGNVGIYLLFRQFYDDGLSLAGSVMYATLSLNLTWLANGTLDVPAVGMTIWLALFAIIAINRNPKFYKYIPVIFVMGFFTRYTVMLTVPALLLYYVYKNGFKIKSEDWTPIKQGILIGIIVGMMIFTVILIMGHGQFGVSYQMASGITGKQGASTDPAYNTELGYYLFNFPNFISNSHTVFDGNPVLENPTPLAWAIFAIMLIGAIIWLANNRIELTKKDLIPIAIILIAAATYTRISSVITTILVLAGLYLLGKDSESKDGYLMLAWIFANALFFSYYSIKVNRYIMPVFPAFIYFALKAVEIIQDQFKINRNIIPIILIVLFIVQGFAYTETFEPTNIYTSTEDMSNYIIDNNPDYQDIPIGTYNIRPYRWWIGGNVVGIPVGNHSGIDSSNMTYYIANTKLDNLTNYTEIKNINNLYLYQKNDLSNK